MHADIWPHRIDILGANSLPREAWDQLLNDLKAEHVPSATPVGKRMAIIGGLHGRIDAIIYRTATMPDEDVIRVLAKYGIPASRAAERPGPKEACG